MSDSISNLQPAALGIEQPITRRDFVGGIALGLLAATTGTGLAAVPSHAAGAALPPAEEYPPALTGLRGQYPGSFEVAHALRDGVFALAADVIDTGESYDLVVVGGGISGLSAAHFYRRALGEDAKVLILDNHDDFGGHAKRNEFHHAGRMYLGYGGTMSIESPFPYSYTAKSLLRELGIDAGGFSRYYDAGLYKDLKKAVFFDRDHFMADRLVIGAEELAWEKFFAAAPLAAAVRADLTRLHIDKVDYLQGMTAAQKVETLRRISYQEYLLRHAKLLPQSLPYFAGAAYRNNMRVDTCPAYTAARYDAPGFAGLALPSDPFVDSEVFHFPDGNASIARLLVSRMVVGVFPPGQTPESIMTVKADYSALDQVVNTTRVRLKSMAVHVEHVGSPSTAKSVNVVYAREGRQYRVTGANVIMACFNNIVRCIVPALPAEQKQALAYPAKVPMLYTNALVRNWLPWKKLGVHSIQAPNGYFSWVSLDIPVSVGEYHFPADPEQPIVVHLVRNPNKPGLPRKEQNRVGRAEMLATSFEQIELEIRSQLARMLGSGGFDAKRDILAITANRWPHGYAYTYDSLGDPDVADNERPHVIGRRPFGRISIANADAGAAAFTNVAIDQADRAVQEALVSRGMT